MHEEHSLSDLFLKFLLERSMRVQADLVDQLFNSSEKRLARILLLMAEFGKPGEPEQYIPKISQETLAEMIGTTRSRVSFFMNRFRKLGFIEYNGRIKVHKSLLNAVLLDQLPERNPERPIGSPSSTKCPKGGQPSAVSVDYRPQPHIGISFRYLRRNRFRIGDPVGAGSGVRLLLDPPIAGLESSLLRPLLAAVSFLPDKSGWDDPGRCLRTAQSDRNILCELGVPGYKFAPERSVQY